MALSREEISQIAKEAADKVVSAAQGCRCGKVVWDARTNIASLGAVINFQESSWLQPLPRFMEGILPGIEKECGVDMTKAKELTARVEYDIKKRDWQEARADLALLQGSIVGPLEQCATEGEKESGVEAGKKEIHNPAVFPQDLAEKVRELWRKACEWEDIPLDSKFVVFSEDNPFVKDYNEAVGQLLRWKQFRTGEWVPATTFRKGEGTRLDGLEVVKAYKQISRHGEDKISVSLQAWALFPRGRRPHFISMYKSGDEYVITPLYAHVSEWVHVPVVKVKAWIKSLLVKHFEPMAVAPEYREEAERLAKEVDEPMAIVALPSMTRQATVIPTESELTPATIELLAKSEGDPLRKFCCRLCGECAPPELLEEGRFPDRIAWLRHHYKEKHPGMWGKMQPAVIPQAEKERKTIACFYEMAEWFAEHRREMTTATIRQIASKYFGMGDELTEFYKSLITPQGVKEFRKILREVGRRHGIEFPPEREYLPMASISEELKQPAVIPTKPSPRLPSPKQELEFVSDSPEFLAYTIEDIGYRDKLDTAFETAIARAKGAR